MKPAAFEYCRPDTLDEALELLHELGPDASVLAGGMSLGAMLNMRLVRPAAVVDIKRIPGLDAAIVAGEVRTGATLTQARQNCTSGGFTGVAPNLAQYRIGPLDADLRCAGTH